MAGLTKHSWEALRSSGFEPPKARAQNVPPRPWVGSAARGGATACAALITFSSATFDQRFQAPFLLRASHFTRDEADSEDDANYLWKGTTKVITMVDRAETHTALRYIIYRTSIIVETRKQKLKRL